MGDSFGERGAAHYDTAIAHGMSTEAVVDFLRETLLPVQRVLEIGVGTGRVAAALAAFVDGEIVGTDISASMLAKVRERGCPNLRTVHHDITASPPEGRFDGAYCVFNTLFMVGSTDRQDAALRHIRAAVATGARFVLELFQPNDETYQHDSLHLEPQHLDATSVRLTVSRIRSAERIVEMQNVILTQGAITLVPSSFHYRTVDELDVAARCAGWALEARYGSWQRSPYRPTSMNSVSVYRAI